MKIMIFLEGTIFYTKPLLFLFSRRGYIPIGNCVSIINAWKNQGAEIILCTYVRKGKIPFITGILKYYGLHYDRICYREKGKAYHDLVEEVKPDVLIEDDCKSIGGSKSMCITHVEKGLKEQIISIVVSEFAGIDHLSTRLDSFYPEKKKYMIVGASGFLGCTIYESLKKKGHEVFGTYSTHKSKEELYPINLLERDEIIDLYKRICPDVVIWTVRSYANGERIAESSLKGLVSALDGKTRFLFLSTQLAYEKNMDENITPLPRTEDMYIPNYYNGKIKGEYYVAKYDNHVIIRPGSIYGKDAYGNEDFRTKELINHMSNHEKYERAGNICFSVVEVNELTQAVIELSQNDFRGIINISEDSPISHYEFCKAMCKKYHLQDDDLIENCKEENIYFLNNDLRKKVLKTVINELERAT